MLLLDYKYTKIIYVYCRWRNEYRSDPRSYMNTTAILTHDLCDTGAALYQL